MRAEAKFLKRGYELVLPVFSYLAPFGDGVRHVPVIIFGAGGVGQALLQQIIDGRSQVAARNQIRFDVVAVADSASLAWGSTGLVDAQLLGIIEAKRVGLPANPNLCHHSYKLGQRPSNLDILEFAHAAELKNAIVVDVTAEPGLEPALDRALELGYSLALANKKALAGPWQTARKYFHHPRIRHESTVGGGQPIIATLRNLLDTNDPIYVVEGQLSGTLGYICRQLDRSIPFSQAVATAKANGYTEPDPREDLGGKDVMRKLMILGRLAGWPLEETDIAVEPLYPASMAALSVPQFMQAVSDLDEAMHQRVAMAAAACNMLRYVAQLKGGGGSVGLRAVPNNSPLASLKYISFRTARYHDEPLFVGSNRTGVELTAAGVLGDMIALVREGNSLMDAG